MDKELLAQILALAGSLYAQKQSGQFAALTLEIDEFLASLKMKATKDDGSPYTEAEFEAAAARASAGWQAAKDRE